MRPTPSFKIYSHHLPLFAAALALLVAAGAPAAAQELVSFPTEDGGLVYADVYGKGERGVVLAHGGRFNKASWERQARALAEDGFRVLAIDFRGYGDSRGPGDADPLSASLHLDVLAAVRHLKSAGAKSISVVGASMGGTAAGDAAIHAPGEIDRLIILAAWADGSPEKLTGRKLFIVAREDTRGDGVVRLARIREQFDKAPEPKELLVLEGSAHAQALFETEQNERLMSEIRRFLSEPAVAAGAAAATPESASTLPVLEAKFEPLRGAFNRDADKVRLVLLLDPT